MGESILGEVLRAELKKLIREAIREELACATYEGGHPTGLDGLVNSDKAAEYLALSRSWLYKNCDRLPFAKKVGGALRFDKRGMRLWLESRRR